MKLKYVLAVMTIFLLLPGCTVSTKDTVVISKPLSSITDKVFNDDYKLFYAEDIVPPRSLAILPLTNETEETNAPLVLRQVINSQLSGMNFTLMHPVQVDHRLPNGMTDPATITTHLGVDAVIIGRVIEFERLYAGIYARTKLGVALDMYDSSGNKIWSVEKTVSENAGGVSTTIWGALLAAATAAMHLDDVNLYAAADRLGRDIAKVFPQPESYTTVVGPSIAEVLHDSAKSVLKYGDVIKVGVKGEPGQLASVEIKGLYRADLTEVEAGVYLGDIAVEPEWQAQDVGVRGILQDANGNISTQLSVVGLLSFDNQAPIKVKNIQGTFAREQLKLSWRGAEDSKQYKIFEVLGDDMQLLATTDQPSLNIEFSKPQFSTHKLAVIAYDLAGNASPTNEVSITHYPTLVPLGAEVSTELNGHYDNAMLLTRSNSPYLVSGDVTVSERGKILVEPGVVLQFSGNAGIRVYGEMELWGESEKVIFEPLNQTKREAPFLSLLTEQTVELNGLRIEGAGVAIEATKGAPKFNSLEIVNSLFSALVLRGDTNAHIEYCLIDGSNTSAIVVSEYAKLKINGCTIRNNNPFHIQNASSYEIDATDNQWQPAAGVTTILGKVRID